MHPYSTQALTGLRPVESNYANAPVTEAGATALPEGLGGLLSPQNPLFWFGVVIFATTGLIGVSGSARLGKGKISATIGA